MTSLALVTGRVLDVARTFPDNTFHGMFSDPPYGLSFMGAKWDYDVPCAETCAEMLRIVRPGAYMAWFGGARTYHRVATRLEDAGWELRDCIMWLHAKGRPATTDQKLAPRGFNTALKPAWEPIIIARKPFSEKTLMANWRRWGTGAMRIEGNRIGDSGGTSKAGMPPGTKEGNALMGSKSGAFNIPGGGALVPGLGRWPANLALDEEAAALLDAEVGPRPSNPYAYREEAEAGERAAHLGGLAPVDGGQRERELGPSRFFFCPKVSRSERNAGLEAFPVRTGGEATNREDGSAGVANARAGAGRTGGHRNIHPTLKPLALNRWIASLLRPEASEAVLWNPYAGTCSEAIGAIQAEWPAVVSVEMSPEYVALGAARVRHWTPGARLEAA